MINPNLSIFAIKVVSWRILGVASVLATMSWLLIDYPLIEYVEANRTQTIFRIFKFISDACLPEVWLTLAATMLLFPYLSRLPGAFSRFLSKFRWRVIAFHLAISMGISGLIVNLIKLIVGRQRPSFYLDTGTIEFTPFSFIPGTDAFPSGHAQSIWAAMMSLCLAFPKLSPIFLLVAALGAASRVVLTRHFLSDIIIGSAIAIVCAFYLKYYFEKRWGSFRKC